MDALSMLLQKTQHLSETKYFNLKISGEWSYSMTSSDAIYFYLVQSGSFYISIEGVLRQVRKGDIFMIPNTYEHVCHAIGHHGQDAKPLDKTLFKHNQGLVNLTDVRCALEVQLMVIECQYDKELLQPLLSALPAIIPEHGDMHESRFRGLDVAIDFITLESQYNRLGKLTMINFWATILMVECLRTYIERLSDASDNWLVAMRDPYLSKALAMMHDSLDYNWTTQKLAKECGMSRSSFTQRFKETVGVPPLTYLSDYRLRVAARHLRLQQNSIGQIGELVGYGSNSTFSQAFKREYGMSPKTYREQHQVPV